MISDIYKKKFTSAGFEAVVAENGTAVLKNMESDKFDLVLLDMVLPEMSGIEILKKLKDGKHDPNMKVIIFSNLSDKTDHDEAIKNGADGFIGKTQYTPSELVVEIQRILSAFGEEKKNGDRIANSNTESVSDGGKKKILFIEDEDIFIDMVEKKLTDEGFVVEVAKNGNWAVKEAMQKDFDLIITDLVLPNMNGEEIIQKLKGEEKTKNIPIIALSASVEEKDLAKVKELGVTECYQKTHIIPSDLARRISDILK